MSKKLSKLGVILAWSTASFLSFGCERPGPEETKPAPSPGASSHVPGSSARAAYPRGSRAEKRALCTFRAGARPAETLDVDAPLGEKIPIDHFVVVLQENRSFDHYLQKLPEYGQPDVDVSPADYENPDPAGDGEIVHPFRIVDPCVRDVPHNWVAVHHQLGEGKMGGFLAAANPGGRRALGYYDATTLPFYYALANTFAIGDRYFASVPGPTFPNRMFFLSGSSFGHAANTAPPPRDEESTLFHELERAKLSWVLYAEGATFEEKMYPRLRAEKGEHFRTLPEYFEDARAGKLPFFSWVESTYGGVDATDEHAPADVQVGQELVSRVVRSMMASPNWPRSALFLTYDEHGGFFDHVSPPHACPPDEEPPHIAGVHPATRFDRLGVRVPFIVISPFARAHFVSHATHSHTSVLRLVQARANLPALTHRDANEDPPFEFFDFDHPPFVTPPTLPDAVVDAAEKKRCFAMEPEEKVSIEHPSEGAAKPRPSAIVRK